MRILISLVLLVSLSFSMAHEYVFAFYDTEHCDTTEYINELKAPSDHGDICDIHFEYHQAFILTPLIKLSKKPYTSAQIDLYSKEYTFSNILEFSKPPIS